MLTVSGRLIQLNAMDGGCMGHLKDELCAHMITIFDIEALAQRSRGNISWGYLMAG